MAIHIQNLVITRKLCTFAFQYNHKYTYDYMWYLNLIASILMLNNKNIAPIEIIRNLGSRFRVPYAS